MNSNDLLNAIGEAQEEYLLDALQTKDAAHRSRIVHMPIRKMGLIAAVIAMALLLVGCGVVYVLRMQDLKVGDQQGTGIVRDGNGDTQLVEMPQQILTRSGPRGSASYQAAQDWYNFKQSYDPDYEIGRSFGGKMPDIPEEYGPYGAYTQEMADKVDEIAARYGLKRMGLPVWHRTSRTLLNYLGVESLLASGSSAELDLESASYYESGSLRLDFNLRLPESSGWPYASFCELCLCPGDCFDPALIVLDDTGDWKQWNYRTAEGDDLLIARSPSDTCAWIFLDRPDGAVTLRVESIREYFDSQWQFGSDPMTDRQLEQMAETIDWKLSPRPGDPELLSGTPEGLDPSVQSQTQNGVTVTVKKVETDGHRAYVTLGITAPEGVVLPGNPQQAAVAFGNIREDYFAPQYRRTPNGGWQDVQILNDGDGKGNTMDIQIRAQRHFADGKDAFSPEEPWTLYIQDIAIETVENFEFVDAWRGEGVWQFDISFADGDFRELEFIREPVTTKAVTRRVDNTDLFEDVTVTSFKLRTYSGTVTIRGMAAGCEIRDPETGKYPYVVLKDGSRIWLNSTNAPMYDRPLPMEEAAKLVLPDGTELSAVNPF